MPREEFQALLDTVHGHSSNDAAKKRRYLSLFQSHQLYLSLFNDPQPKLTWSTKTLHTLHTENYLQSWKADRMTQRRMTQRRFPKGAMKPCA
jgi:hypothetical protein